MTINELHEVARTGDRAAEEQLFKNLSESFRIFVQQRVWNEIDAEEIVQDALTTIAAKYREIDFTISFAAWGYKTLENKILHYYRTKKYRESRMVQSSEETVTAGVETPNPDIKRRLLTCFRKISGVNPRYARILNLRYQGYSTEEICRRLGVTRNNVYILLSRARSMLKGCLEKGDVD